MAAESWDVIIIGAGVAGLAAAAALRDSGRSLLILEARDRIGGRAWTRHEPGLEAPIELGAEFIHGNVPETFELLRAVGHAALDTSGAHWTLQNGKLTQRTEDLFGEIQHAISRSRVLEAPDITFEAFLERSGRAGLSREAIAMARAFVEGFDAADPARVSAQSVAQEWQSGGMLDGPQYRPSGGYGSLLLALAGSLQRERARVQLHTTVTAVSWRRGAVEVAGHFREKPFRASARRLIVTLPLGVLQAAAQTPGAVRFTPPLEAKRTALQGLASGPVLKVSLRFRDLFWEQLENGRYMDAAFFHSPDTLFPTFWTPRPLRAPLLTAWVGGPKATRLSEQQDDVIVDEALASLAIVFGDGAIGELEGAYMHNWQTDPLARGAYSYVTVGGSGARQSLAAPLEETVFFAGEAAAEEAATITGALQSGRIAAHRVAESFV